MQRPRTERPTAANRRQPDRRHAACRTRRPQKLARGGSAVTARRPFCPRPSSPEGTCGVSRCRARFLLQSRFRVRAAAPALIRSHSRAGPERPGRWLDRSRRQTDGGWGILRLPRVGSEGRDLDWGSDLRGSELRIPHGGSRGEDMQSDRHPTTTFARTNVVIRTYLHTGYRVRLGEGPRREWPQQWAGAAWG